MVVARGAGKRWSTARERTWRRHAGQLAAVALLVGSGAARAATRPPACETVSGNLVSNCGFTKDLRGWRSQAITTLEHDSHRGRSSPGALRMTNQPASEAGAATCVGVEGAATYRLSGWLQRLQGEGECLTFLEEHATLDCSAGALASHELVSTPLVPGRFTEVTGIAAVGPRTVAVRGGFACYGEQDDDVSGVLLDDVVLQKVTGGAEGDPSNP